MIYLVLAAVALSGCTQDAPERHGPEEALGDAGPGPVDAAQETTGQATQEAPPTRQTTSADAYQNATHEIRVHFFHGPLVGASPPNGLGGMHLGEPWVPPTWEDEFEAPNGTIALSFGESVDWWNGTGSFRLEVVGPDGRIVHMSYTGYNVQSPVAAGGGYRGWTVDDLGPGTYQVRYYVVGALEVRSWADATLVGADPCSAGGQPDG